MQTEMSTQDVQRYNRDGYLLPLEAMSEQEALGFRERVEAFENANPTGRPFNQVVKSKSHLLCLAVLELVQRSKFLMLWNPFWGLISSAGVQGCSLRNRTIRHSFLGTRTSITGVLNPTMW